MIHDSFRPCPLCEGKTNLFLTAFDENHRISKVPYDYLKCSLCHGIFLDSVPFDLGQYYKSEYYEILPIEKLQKVADKDRNKINTVLRFASGGRLLEVGPAFGVFAWQAKQAGFYVDVIEMDERCCEYLAGTLDVNVTQSNDPPVVIREMPKHEVIAIWHVLEHLNDPLAFLRAAAANLKSKGVLVIAMPNPDAWQFKIMGRRWPHLDAPRHLTLIPEVWMTEQALELGLERVYLTSDDRDARSWNRFGWQRLLMNRFKGKIMQHAMFFLGYVVSLVMAFADRRNFNGSAYTIIYQKK